MRVQGQGHRVVCDMLGGLESVGLTFDMLTDLK